MTKKERFEHIQKIEKMVVSFGYVKDRWGNYKKEFPDDRIYRIKFMKNNLRIEKRYPDNSWMRLYSIPYIRVNIDELEKYLNKIEVFYYGNNKTKYDEGK